MIDLNRFNVILKKGEFDRLQQANKDNFHWQQIAIKKTIKWVNERSKPISQN